uniref:Hydrophobic seed protein domain-containing protein n=1 Tax=Oryza brachyantha TaxID=4533 RepID=J3LFC3_ORYBR
MSRFLIPICFLLPLYGFIVYFSLDLCCSCTGGVCCDEDNKLPLLKTLRTLAGRIEPINLATTE